MHNLIALDLGGTAMQDAHIGDGVVGLGEVGIAEGVRDAIVEPLNSLILFLAQILETDAKSFCGVPGCVGL